MKFSISVAMQPAGNYLPMAVAAEESGWDNVVVPDSVFYPEQVSAPYPYTATGQRFWAEQTPFLDPWVAIPAMAAVTRRVRFYPHVMKLAIRQPLLVAKMVGSAAVLSGNRVCLGAGLGWIPEEFEWCDTEYRTRGKRMNEALEIIRALLAGGYVSYEGEHYRFGRIRMDPAPSEKVPFIIGGHSEPALRRAARFGDGWTSAMTTRAELAGFIARLRELRQEYGRADEPFEIAVVCTDAFGVAGARDLGEMGVTDIITQPWLLYGGGLSPTAEQAEEGIRRFAEDIISEFR